MRAGVMARRLAELSRREQRWALLRTGTTVVAWWVVLVGGYYLLPVDRVSDKDIVTRLAVGLVLLAVLLVWQIHRITRAELPELRAVTTLGAVIPVFLVVFAVSYVSLSTTVDGSFSERLDHTRGLYFTVTVFATVGFGDITPTTDLTRIVVSVQMLLNLVVIGAVVRVLIGAARTGLTRAAGDARSEPEHGRHRPRQQE